MKIICKKCGGEIDRHWVPESHEDGSIDYFHIDCWYMKQGEDCGKISKACASDVHSEIGAEGKRNQARLQALLQLWEDHRSRVLRQVAGWWRMF